MPHSQILNAFPDATILTNTDGVVQSWNDAATQIFGWQAGEMIGRPLAERFPAAAQAEVREYIKHLASGGVWDGEFEDYHKDGSRIWIEAHVHPVRNHSGTITGILGVFRLISPDRAAAIAKERHDQYSTDILNSMYANVAILGRDGRILQVNRAWERFAEENSPAEHSSASTNVGINYVSLCRGCTGVKAEEAIPAAQGIEDVLRGKRSFFVMEYPCDSPTETRWFAMHVTPLTTKDGGAVVAHYDITARKKAEQAVANESRRTELALAAAHMGVWTLELKSGRINWSPEVYKITGLVEFDGTQEAWFRLIHPDDLPMMQERFNEAVKRLMPFTGEFRIIQPNGDVRWLANVSQVECDPSGDVVAVVGTVQDITSRKRSEWALMAYNQILEMIAAGADLHIILNEVVRLVEEQLPGSLCSVLIVDKATGCLRSGSGRSLPAEYNRGVDGVRIGPKAGSCGTAAFRKATVTVTDIATDPLWEDYRDLALRHGLRSCVSVPILSSGNVPGHEKGAVIGTFALYNKTPGNFDRLTYAILTGAEQLVRRAVQTDRGENSRAEGELTQVIEATHLAGVAIERDHAGNAIRESEERFRAVFDSAPSAIFVKDLDGRHVFVNQATANLFGVPPEKWLGKLSRDLLPEYLAVICEQSDRTVLANQHPVEERLTCHFPDGREATVLATHMLLRHADGAPYAICGILRDITDLVAAQQEFERLWLHAPDPLCIAGFDGYFKQVNPVWSRILGWTDEELLRMPYNSLVHPDDLLGLAQAEQRLNRGEVLRGYENRYRCRDGSYRWLSWNAIPVPENRLIYGITRDVTEEKRLGEQVRQAQKMEAVGQLASGVAHDFNNLLTVINGYTELLLDGIATNDPNREPLTQVLEAGQRATELTTQLLAFSRKAIIEPKILDVNQVVESSARMLRRLIGENIRLVTNPGEIPLVKIDPGQLEQLFMNLAVNARDAMPNGGQLSIVTETVELPQELPTEMGMIVPGKYVSVSVTDTGTGMTPEVQNRIFEPFFTTKGPGKGTGLGLATVYGIVQQAGGTIKVESEPLRGTTFRILLPVVKEMATGPKSVVITVAPRGTETVLIAEDEEGVRNIADTILQLQGYTVLVAASGAEAVSIASKHPRPIHLLLTDVVMPDFGGRTLASEVRKLQNGVRVLYMSGYTDDAVIRSGVESSKDSFIQKPFTPLTLARRVREVLDTPAELVDQ